MSENTMPLIKKLIEETKNENLKWRKYDEHIDSLKPTKKGFFSSGISNYDSPVYNSCYLSQFDNTLFILIAYDTFSKGGYISLFAQTTDSTYSIRYATTDSADNSNTNEISELKRLYNLVETYSDLVEDSVRKFINL